MNFLSHFYFDKDTDDCYHVLGTVLPDLLKNADKTIVLHPEKLRHADTRVNSIVAGWNKHLEVDRHFHSSPFFLEHSHRLKLSLRPGIEGSPVKPFFLGHIAIELILDNLLLTTGVITAHTFYDHLEGCQAPVIAEFLSSAGLKNSEGFFRFFDDFKKSRYLYTYAETRQIAYALKRICMRVWKDPFTPAQETAIEATLANYRVLLTNTFMPVFDEIAAKLTGDPQ